MLSPGDVTSVRCHWAGHPPHLSAESSQRKDNPGLCFVLCMRPE